MQYRQGDVLLVEVEEFDLSGYQKAEKPTVALGEATGHHHTFDGDVDVYEKTEESTMAVNERGMLVEIKSDKATLVHQEHGAIEVPKGKYQRIIQRQYTPAGIVNVAD